MKKLFFIISFCFFGAFNLSLYQLDAASNINENPSIVLAAGQVYDYDGEPFPDWGRVD